MVNWHVISDVGMVHSGIGAGNVLGCPYLFVAGRNQVTPDETADAGRAGRVWIGIPQDSNLFSDTRWKWNMRWEPLFQTRDRWSSAVKLRINYLTMKIPSARPLSLLTDNFLFRKKRMVLVRLLFPGEVLPSLG